MRIMLVVSLVRIGWIMRINRYGRDSLFNPKWHILEKFHPSYLPNLIQSVIQLLPVNCLNIHKATQEPIPSSIITQLIP